MDVGATQNNLYTLEDKLVMTFESEALHLLLVRDQVVKSVAVSATAEPQDGNGGSRGNGTTIMTTLASMVSALTNADTREKMLVELSKHREEYPDLAPALWYSTGTIAALLQVCCVWGGCTYT